MAELLPGRTTPDGTATYRQRMADRTAAGHFREHEGRWLSSIGLGTYLGDDDEATDALYRDAIVRAVELGLNVLDGAINYRSQRSERVIGHLPAALAEHLGGLAADAQRAIQFVRSTPGVGTALVGMKRSQHVEENAGVAQVSPVPEETLRHLFR